MHPQPDSERRNLTPLLCLLALFLTCLPSAAQDNYEIQVYAYDTVPPGSTMLELHSNFTVDGTKTVIDGVQPTHHAEHETIEITQGINHWFETGVYIFPSIQPNGCSNWVGDIIRPCGRVPQSWPYPVVVRFPHVH